MLRHDALGGCNSVVVVVVVVFLFRFFGLVFVNIVTTTSSARCLPDWGLSMSWRFVR